MPCEAAPLVLFAVVAVDEDAAEADEPELEGEVAVAEPAAEPVWVAEPEEPEPEAVGVAVRVTPCMEAVSQIRSCLHEERVGIGREWEGGATKRAMRWKDREKEARSRQGTRGDNRRNRRTTARQSCCAAASALVRSEPEHALVMQLVTEEMKPESWQRQESSRGSQLPKLALVRHDSEQSIRTGAVSWMTMTEKSQNILGKDCLRWRDAAETAAARARTAKKRILLVQVWR